MTMARRVASAATLLVLAIMAGTITGCASGSSGPSRSAASSPGGEDGAALHALLVRAVADTVAVEPRHVLSTAELVGQHARHLQTVDGHAGMQSGSSEVTMVSDGTRSEARTVGSSSWFASAAAQVVNALPSGASWIALSPAQLASVGVPSVSDQLAPLYVLFGAHDEADRGTERIDGVSTKHVSAAIDLGKAVCAAPPSARSTVATIFTSSSGSHPRITADAWIDTVRLIRQLRVTVALGAGSTATYGVTVSGNNAALSVVAPPAAQQVPLNRAPAFAAFVPTAPPAPPSC